MEERFRKFISFLSFLESKLSSNYITYKMKKPVRGCLIIWWRANITRSVRGDTDEYSLHIFSYVREVLTVPHCTSYPWLSKCRPLFSFQLYFVTEKLLSRKAVKSISRKNINCNLTPESLCFTFRIIYSHIFRFGEPRERC